MRTRKFSSLTQYGILLVILGVVILLDTYYSEDGFQNIEGINTISFTSYGNETFILARERIQREAKEMGCFDGQIKVYTPEDLSVEFKAAVGDVLNEKRGGGYWTWKPYVIADMLSKLNDGDTLVYTDAGCKLQPAGVPRLNEYIAMISPQTNRSVLAMRLRDQLAKKWTSTHIFEQFNQSVDGEISNSNIIPAGVVICRKCPESERLIERWLEIAKTRPDLFTNIHDEESKESNPDFVENRHDQAIWNMLVQLPPYNKYCAVIPEEIESGPFNYPPNRPIIASRKNS